MTIRMQNGAMIRSVAWADRFAITVSAMCVLHCLLTPLLLVTVPILNMSLIDSESLHQWAVYAVIPTSLFALGMGCTKHRRALFMLIGLFGLSLLLIGISVELIGINNVWETVFTVLGALFIALAHILNFNQCRESTDCSCH